MKQPRSTGLSLIFKSKIYVFGGYSGDQKRSKTIEVYDPSKNYWESLNVSSLLFRSNFTGASRPDWCSPSSRTRSC